MSPDFEKHSTVLGSGTVPFHSLPLGKHVEMTVPLGKVYNSSFLLHFHGLGAIMWVMEGAPYLFTFSPCLSVICFQGGLHKMHMIFRQLGSLHMMLDAGSSNGRMGRGIIQA